MLLYIKGEVKRKVLIYNKPGLKIIIISVA